MAKGYFNDDVALFTGISVKCEHCGNVRRFHNKENDRLLCYYCNNWVYMDEKAKLKYKNKEQINKLKNLLLF